MKNKIKVLRAERNMTQEDLAIEVQVSRQTKLKRRSTSPTSFHQSPVVLLPRTAPFGCDVRTMSKTSVMTCSMRRATSLPNYQFIRTSRCGRHVPTTFGE